MIVPTFVGVPVVTHNLHHSNLPCYQSVNWGMKDANFFIKKIRYKQKFC